MSKYGAIKTEIDGITFASKKEAHRYSELKLLERAGEIANLVLQPRFPLKVGGALVCTYVADFSYQHRHGDIILNGVVVEDAKGMKTPVYKLKAKLFEAIHGFPIREV